MGDIENEQWESPGVEVKGSPGPAPRVQKLLDNVERKTADLEAVRAHKAKIRKLEAQQEFAKVILIYAIVFCFLAVGFNAIF